MPDDVQPDVEGQGDEGTGGLFDSYLQSVPEDAREVVGGYLADAAKNVNSRYEEIADLRKTFEPYQGLSDELVKYQPEELGQLLTWHQQVASSDEAFRSWLTQAAQEQGLTPNEERQLEEAAENLTPDQIRAMAQEMATSSLAPLQDRLDQFESAQFVNAESQLVATSFANLERDNKITLTSEQKDRIVDLGMAASKDEDTLVNGKDWIKTGFDELQKIYAEGQKMFLDDKAKQPKAAVSGGALPAAPGNDDWKVASEQARERLRQSRA